MKKFILLAILGISVASFQTTKAQVSFSLTVGPQPQYVIPAGYTYGNYYEPVYVNRTYYTAPRRYVAVRNHYVSRRPIIVRNRVYRSSYSRPVARHYVSRNYGRPHGNYHMMKSHGKGHGRKH